jgi:hypothetical protein
MVRAPRSSTDTLIQASRFETTLQHLLVTAADLVSGLLNAPPALLWLGCGLPMGATCTYYTLGRPLMCLLLGYVLAPVL